MSQLDEAGKLGLKSDIDIQWLMGKVSDCTENEIDGFVERVAILVHESSTHEDQARQQSLDCLLRNRKDSMPA